MTTPSTPSTPTPPQTRAFYVLASQVVTPNQLARLDVFVVACETTSPDDIDTAMAVAETLLGSQWRVLSADRSLGGLLWVSGPGSL